MSENVFLPAALFVALIGFYSVWFSLLRTKKQLKLAKDELESIKGMSEIIGNVFAARYTYWYPRKPIAVRENGIPIFEQLTMEERVCVRGKWWKPDPDYLETLHPVQTPFTDMLGRERFPYGTSVDYKRIASLLDGETRKGNKWPKPVFWCDKEGNAVPDPGTLEEFRATIESCDRWEWQESDKVAEAICKLLGWNPCEKDVFYGNHGGCPDWCKATPKE